MPAPLAKGLIIAASVLVAAGIAIYENPQIRQWADQTRRKIAIALHSLGDEIQPRRPGESSDDFEARKRRREEVVRRNRNELIRRAREEGIAVDLDELARIGDEAAEVAQRRSRADRTRSFDDMVGNDGMLRNGTKATGTDTSNGDVRKRGVVGFAAAAAAMANPFSDDQVLFDNDEDEAPSPKPFTYEEADTCESSATVQGDAPVTPATTGTLVDLTPDPEHSIPETEISAQPAHEDADQATQSFYSFTSQIEDPAASTPFFNDEAEHVSTGTLTPRSERSMTFSASVTNHADDIAILSMQNSVQNDADHDTRSEVFSDGGFTDAGFSEGGFSEFEEGRQGTMTPNSWTDVGSDDESEWGGAAQHGHVSQVHQ